MPTYDYKCTNCENVFEKFHGMNESPEILCPECNAISKKKISLGAGIVFKGSGFYVNDYKKSNKNKQTEKKNVNNNTVDKNNVKATNNTSAPVSLKTKSKEKQSSNSVS